MSWVPTEIPLSTIFVVGLALLLTFITSMVNRLLTNKEQLASWRKELSAWQEELSKARKSGDKKLLDKAIRKQKQIMQIQSKMFTQQMKVSLIFIVPFFLFWTWLNSVPFEYIIIVNNAPVDYHFVAFLPGFGGLTVFYWYLFCSLAFGTMFSHILGIGTGATDE
jgi:uncharacterized membrane protein (DUF106 family)